MCVKCSSIPTEKQKTQRHKGLRDPEDADESEEFRPQPAQVTSLSAAVALALTYPLDEECLFTFSRALLTLQATTGKRLPKGELENAFNLWWATAQPRLPADQQNRRGNSSSFS